MSPVRALIVLAALAVLAAATPRASEPTPRLAEAREAVASLGEQLKEELQVAMKEGGPTQAIAVCQRVAGPIAAELSKEQGLVVGRTSERLRNPDNAPDAYESSVLAAFAARRAEGETFDTLEHWSVEQTESGEELRYMKAIGTGPICARCHGTKIDEDVRTALRERYPEDQATGYTPGELRGAFTVRIPLAANGH